MPEQIGHFSIIRELGRGGMGVVYEALDTDLERRVALKRLPGAEEADPGARERLLAEARAAAALNHPAICTVHEIVESGGRYWIAMELVPGESLAARLARGPLAEDEIVTVVGDVASGLAAAHAAGILHRDIKPDNIMIMPDGRAKLMDFGLARRPAVDAPGGDDRSGTLDYMAPEILRGEAPTPAADLWALGLVLYECLTGDHPFREPYAAATAYRILHTDPPDLQGRRDLAPRLRDLVARTVVRSVARRLDSAGAFAAALAPVPRDPASHAGRPLRRAGIPTLVTATLVGLTLIVAAIWNSGGDEGREPPSLAVMGFMGSGPAEDPDFPVGVAELLNIGLVESGPVRVVSPEYLADVARRLTDGRAPDSLGSHALEVARRARADFLLTGRVIRQGARPGVLWRLVDTATGNTLGGQVSTGEQTTAVVDAVIAAVAPLLGRVTDLPGTGPPRPVGEMTTASPTAYRHYVAGLLASRSQQQSRAVAELQAALAADSTFALAAFALSREYAALYGGIGDAGATRRWSDQAWRNRDRLALRDRLRLEAWRTRMANEYAEARRTLTEIVTRWPDDRQALHDLMELRWYHWEFADALTTARQGARHFADDTEFLTTVALCLSYLGRQEEALPVARRVALAAGDDPNAWHHLAEIHLAMGHPDSAEIALRRGLAADPDFLLARIDLAACAYARGDLDPAIGQLEAICAQDTFAGGRIRVLTSDSFRPALTMLYADAGRPAAVADALARAERLAGETAIAGRMARTRVRLGRPDLALAWSDSVLAADPVPAAWFNAMMVRPTALAHLDRLAAAREALAALAARDDEFGGLARFFVGTARVEIERLDGDPDAALRAADAVAAAGFPPGGMFEIEFREARARALHAAGDVDGALRQLEDLARRYGGRPATRLLLSRWYVAAGRTADARRALTRALELWHAAEPEFAPARVARQRLAELPAGS